MAKFCKIRHISDFTENKGIFHHNRSDCSKSASAAAAKSGKDYKIMVITEY